MNKLRHRILKVLGSIMAILVVLLIGLVIYYWGAIDRIYIRPCHYYPQAFIDCKEQNTTKGEF